MSDFPFSIPRTSDATKIENGTSKMEIASAGGPCVFTPAGLTTKTTTFAADGTITTSGDITCDHKLFGDGATLEMMTNTSVTDSKGWITLRVNDTIIGGPIIKFYSNSTASSAGTQRMTIIANGNIGINDTSPSEKLEVGGNIKASGTITPSDDRLKENEKVIINATETLSKLTPQIYDKYDNMDLSGSSFVESGLITQEVYYNAPELRHLVHLGKNTDASGNQTTPTPEEMDLTDVDIANDPDYGSHGWSIQKSSSLNYDGLIPYLIKSNQEMAERLAALENK